MNGVTLESEAGKYTYNDIGKLLKVKPSTIHTWKKKGFISHKKQNGVNYVSSEELGRIFGKYQIQYTYTYGELAQLFKMNINRVRNMGKSGELRIIRPFGMNSIPRIPESEVRAFLANNRYILGKGPDDEDDFEDEEEFEDEDE